MVLACSLAWSGFDTVRKVLVRRVAPVPLVFLLTLGQVPLFAAWVGGDGVPAVSQAYLAPAAGSILLNVAANLGFIYAIQLSPLSLTIPFLSLTPVFTTLLAAPLLGEWPTPLQTLGILVVVAGAFGLNLERGEGVTLPGLWRAFLRERGGVLMVGVAVLWSIAMPLDKLALEAASASFHGLVLSLGVAVGLLVVLAVQGRGRLRGISTVRGAIKGFAVALVLSALALGLQLLAIHLVWVSLVETFKRGIGNVMAMVLGTLIFGERVSREKVMAVGMMVAGVAMILL